MSDKGKSSFLIAWSRQLQQAADAGSELWYGFREFVDLALEELESESGSGDSDPEVGLADGDGGEDPGEASAADADWPLEADQPGLPGLGSAVVDVPPVDHRPPRVPRGTRSGAPAAVDGRTPVLSPVCKRTAGKGVR